MALPVGTKAPDFTLSTKTADGPKQVKLSDNFSKGNTLLLFFPMAFTGTCTTEMCGVTMDLAAYGSLNATVYGISGDNPFAQEAWAKKENIGVPLLSDYEHKVAQAYNVAYDSFLPEINLGMAACPSAPSSSSIATASFNIPSVTMTRALCRTSTKSKPDWRN